MSKGEITDVKKPVRRFSDTEFEKYIFCASPSINENACSARFVHEHRIWQSGHRFAEILKGSLAYKGASYTTNFSKNVLIAVKSQQWLGSELPCVGDVPYTNMDSGVLCNQLP